MKKKKVFFYCRVCMMVLSICFLTGCGKEDNPGNEVNTESYVDLGLTSGTKWKSSNEDSGFSGFISYQHALQFGSQLPSKAQFEELIDECQWLWIGGGYIVTGPNGNFIVLPAAGYSRFTSDVYDEGLWGVYWSSTTTGIGSDYAFCLSITSGDARIIYCDHRSFCLAVRLIQK